MNKKAMFSVALTLAVELPCIAEGKKTAVHIKVLKVAQGTEKITPSNKQQTTCVGGLARPSVIPVTSAMLAAVGQSIA
jgi:hypothetical protein